MSSSFAPTPSTTSPIDYAGLVISEGNGYERMVMSDQEICDDVLATVPKLKAAAAKDTFGRRWKQRKRKNGVDMFELLPGGGDDPDDDLDIAHALVAKTELRCHLNEVLNVLINQSSSDYEASMQSLCGSKVKHGRVLFHQDRTRNSRQGIQSFQDKAAQHGVLGVQLMTVRPKRLLRTSTKHRPTQKLVLATCTQRDATNTRALHVMKTIPKDAHNLVVDPKDRSALRRRLDHLAVGLDIESVHGDNGAHSHRTRVFLHAYASAVAPGDYQLHTVKREAIPPRLRGAATPQEIAQQRHAIMNPDAHHVLNVLAKSLRNMETVVRRRRLGFQSFVYFAPGQQEPSPRDCAVCRESFGLFRRDRFCQLCGHAVCSACSCRYDVEPRAGLVRQNRCCVECIVRVDNCVFDDEDLLAALGPVVVDADDADWDDEYPMLSDLDGDASPFHRHPPQKAESRELERLARLVDPQTSRSATTHSPTDVLHQVHAHVRETVRGARSRLDAATCPVYDREHDYAYTFDPSGGAPRAPRPAPAKEAQRLNHLARSRVLDAGYDRAALDLLAQLAATHLKCSIGYVSVIDAHEQRVVGNFNYPRDAEIVPRDETLCMHGVYAEAPLVLPNTKRDLRFARLPVVEQLGVAFYAGFPVRTRDGAVVASICAADRVPHAAISTKDYAAMEALAALAAELLAPSETQP